MLVMLHRFPIRLWIFAAAFGLVVTCFAAGAKDNSFYYRKYKPPPPTAQITVTVLRNDNEKPIANAAVIFHPLKNGKDQGGMELKSDHDGKVTMTVIPIGDTVLLQIIANGYQTYGSVYKIKKPKMEMEIRMKLPQPDYSTYKNHDTTADSGTGSGPGKAAEPAKGPSASASPNKPSSPAKDKPSGDGKQNAQNGDGQTPAPQK